MKLKATLSIFVAFGFALSSCDKKNASLANIRYATPEKMEEIKEAQQREEEQIPAPLQPPAALPEPGPKTPQTQVIDNAIVVDDHAAGSVSTLAQSEESSLPPQAQVIDSTIVVDNSNASSVLSLAQPQQQEQPQTVQEHVEGQDEEGEGGPQPQQLLPPIELYYRQH
ncbi:hypothetical protein AGMMS50233_00170 [Endomicrobiia bacterium]|nr:hypothetical protein AGMMS50233_00170 [Endomicrobiia bacterium]